MQEERKAIKGFENLYEITSSGLAHLTHIILLFSGSSIVTARFPMNMNLKIIVFFHEDLIPINQLYYTSY
jgi:hypothetical protein